MEKQSKIKVSEARILVFLEKCKPEVSFASHISAKLNIDYVYMMHLLKGMVAQEWLIRVPRSKKVFYKLSPAAPTEQAKKRLTQPKDV